MERIASGEWITRRMQQTLDEKKRELQAAKKTETEQISDLMGEFKASMEQRDASKLKKISQFEPGRQKFVEQLMAQYKYMTVTISGFKYIAKNHQATANVALTNLIDINDHHVTPGAWSKFPIKIAKNSKAVSLKRSKRTKGRLFQTDR